MATTKIGNQTKIAVAGPRAGREADLPHATRRLVATTAGAAVGTRGEVAAEADEATRGREAGNATATGARDLAVGTGRTITTATGSADGAGAPFPDVVLGRARETGTTETEIIARGIVTITTVTIGKGTGTDTVHPITTGETTVRPITTGETTVHPEGITTVPRMGGDTAIWDLGQEIGAAGVVTGVMMEMSACW